MRALALLVAAAAAFPRAAALVVYYNVFSKNVATAVEIVYEQLTELRASPIWTEVDEIRYSTIGMGEWQALYGAVPPESSLLLRKYRQIYGVAAPGRRLLRSRRTTA